MAGSDATTAPVVGNQIPHAAAARASGPLTIGQSVGTRYRILGLLGRGGMGAVYKAWDDQLGLAVALKTIALAPDVDADTAALLEQRFRREALLARQITHRNVVRVHDVGEFEGTKYLTMAFVEGETLSDLMRRQGRMPPRDVLSRRRARRGGRAPRSQARQYHDHALR
jgi:serine/threonine protein kinase